MHPLIAFERIAWQGQKDGHLGTWQGDQLIRPGSNLGSASLSVDVLAPLVCSEPVSPRWPRPPSPVHNGNFVEIRKDCTFVEASWAPQISKKKHANYASLTQN